MTSFAFTPQFEKDFKKLKLESKNHTSKVMELIFSIGKVENPLEGIGQPEALRGNLSGCYSRRITGKHRLIYRYNTENEVILISCLGHYSDK